MDPASLVLSPALQVIFDRLASPALEKLAAIWGVEDNFHSLRDALMRTQAILQDAEEEQLTNKSVKLWLSNLKNAASDAEDLLDLFIADEAIDSVDFEIQVSFFAAMMLNKLERIRKGYDAEKIRKTLHILEKTVNEGLSRFNFREPSRGDRRSTIRETGSCAVDSEIYGRDDEKKTLVKLLLSYETSQDGYATCIPVIGIGGIGKTTLTQLAYNDEGVLKHFNTRIWIFVSEDFNVKKIMKTAIEHATKHKCKFSDIDSLQSELWKSLHNKRYLIVLDDLWTEDQDDWDKLRHLFRQGVDGCKIIVTTRSKKIPLMMDFPNSPIFLNGLTDVDCWSLFKKKRSIQIFGGLERKLSKNVEVCH